jgi:hypothetical protein
VKEMKRYEGLSMEERGRLIVALSEAAAAILESRPDRDEVLAREEPKPPEAEAWWLELVRRERERRRGKPD